MQIKYIGKEPEKSVEAPKGRIYTFKRNETISISETSLCKHLLEKCNDRFVDVGPSKSTSPPKPPKPVKKKK